MKFLHILLLAGISEAFPQYRQYGGFRMNPPVVGSANPVMAARQTLKRRPPSYQATPNIRPASPRPGRNNVGVLDPNPQRTVQSARAVNPAYRTPDGALEVTGGIVNIAGGMVNAVGGVVNVVGARINRIPAPSFGGNAPPTFGINSGGTQTQAERMRIGTSQLDERANPGIVNSNGSTVTIVGGTVNLFEGYSINDAELPPVFHTGQAASNSNPLDAAHHQATPTKPTPVTRPRPTTTHAPVKPAAVITTTTKATTRKAPITTATNARTQAPTQAPTTTTKATTTTTAGTTTTATTATTTTTSTTTTTTPAPTTTTTTTTTPVPTTTPEPTTTTTLSPLEETVIRGEARGRRKPMVRVGETLLSFAERPLQTASAVVATSFFGFAVILCGVCVLTRSNRFTSPAQCSARRRSDITISQLGLRRDIPLTWR